MKRAAAAGTVGAALLLATATAQEPPQRTVIFRFTPTARAQLALWIERPDGTFLRTVRLTQSVGLRGIGNRPGASQMNSGFRWPYGRREGVLPVWAHRRAAAPGAQPFPRVIFQNRPEGYASQTIQDDSPDDYFCLSFRDATTRKDALDAVSCASTFNSDKGRYVTAGDVSRGYTEPQEEAGAATAHSLGATSLYPARRDVARCTTGTCADHADVGRFAADVRRVMPEIDAVTTPTPMADIEQTVYFTVPAEWPDGDYVAWLEANVEGDYNGVWNDASYPTPKAGPWDMWAINFGYPYRGQPSVVFRVPFAVGEGGGTYTTAAPAGYGSLSGQRSDGGELHALDGLITVDPTQAPGSGGDRLRLAGRDYRVKVEVQQASACAGNTPPGQPLGLLLVPHPDEKHSHQWARMSFVVPAEDRTIVRYEVRTSTEPIVDEESFLRALPANRASTDTEDLVVPVTGAPGSRVIVEFGGLTPSTRYYVALRAVDSCNVAGPISVGNVETTAIHFTQIEGCFVATAAWGTPLASEIDALRRFRDRHLLDSGAGRSLVALYNVVGPALADVIRKDDALRARTRRLLAPAVNLARALEHDARPRRTYFRTSPFP